MSETPENPTAPEPTTVVPPEATESPEVTPDEVAAAGDEGTEELESAPDVEPAKAPPTREEIAKAKKAERLELMKNPEVKRMMAIHGKKAAEEAVAKIQADRDRESLSEVERLTAERDDALAKTQEHAEKLSNATFRSEYAEALMDSTEKIKPKAKKFIQAEVRQLMTDDPDLSVSEATQHVMAEHSDLMVSATTPTPVETVVTPKITPATTTAARKKTVTPVNEEKKPVDVNTMTAQQFKEYKMRVHRAH